MHATAEAIPNSDEQEGLEAQLWLGNPCRIFSAIRGIESNLT